MERAGGTAKCQQAPSERREANRMAEVPDLTKIKPDGEYVHDWLARCTETQLSAYRGYLVAESDAAVDVRQQVSLYQSASYRRYRYQRRIEMVDQELVQRDRTVADTRNEPR